MIKINYKTEIELPVLKPYSKYRNKKLNKDEYTG